MRRSAPGQEKPEQQKTNSLQIPLTIFAATDVPTNIYFDNIVLTQNLDDYRFQVTYDIGQTHKRRWSVQPTDSGRGNHPIRIDVFGANDSLIASASSVLRVVEPERKPTPKPSADPIRRLIIGDSLTNATVYPNEVARLLSLHEGVPWEMLGTHKPNSAADGVAHEGYGGWTWSKLVSKFEPNPDSKKKRSSPFVFLDNESKPSRFNYG